MMTLESFNLAQIERVLIVEALRLTRGIKTDATKALGISRWGLDRRLKKYAIKREEWKK